MTPKWILWRACLGQEHLSCDYFWNFHAGATGPLLITGDFNEILTSSEKEGGAQRPSAMMQVFRNCLADCGLDDVDFIRDPFTWSRGMIREWLNKAVCNGAWPDKFPVATLIHEQHVPFLALSTLMLHILVNLMEAPL